ncbi:ras-related C3 botulinum toxin substrate 1-like [Phymastichus coffea]|uniref:ras-related C3 botulinum toxin substrate 1-like n=1 Tax=Phymastichus coffea TaxID=108790 RepID=UPI00273AFDC4|nr:ras-related C3 botulinum toxin substrate 1-like [Phymastichus coffea]
MPPPPGHHSSSQSWSRPLLPPRPAPPPQMQHRKFPPSDASRRDPQSPRPPPRQHLLRDDKDSSPTSQARIKVVLVGDGAVGKTSLVVSYSTNGFPPEYQPTAFDNYNVVVNVDGQPINVQLCDTAGQDDFDPLRSLCYPDTDVLLICFSIVKPESYRSVSTKWINEVQRHCPNTPIILVGTKSDLRSDVQMSLELAKYGQSPVTTIQGHQLANRIGASSYVETSALTQQDLKEAFDQAIVSALSMRRAGAKLLSRHQKPPSVWRKWLCCWEKSSSSTSSSRA